MPRVPACLSSTWASSPPSGQSCSASWGESWGCISQSPFPVGVWVRTCHCDGSAQDPEVLRGGETLFSRWQTDRHFGKVLTICPNDVLYAPQTLFPFFQILWNLHFRHKIATSVLFPSCFCAPFLFRIKGLWRLLPIWTLTEPAMEQLWQVGPTSFSKWENTEKVTISSRIQNLAPSRLTCGPGIFVWTHV